MILPNCPACGKPLVETILDVGRLVSCRNGECLNRTASDGLFARGGEPSEVTAEVLVRIVSARIKRGAE